MNNNFKSIKVRNYKLNTNKIIFPEYSAIITKKRI